MKVVKSAEHYTETALDEIRLLKQLADELNICLLLVHHLRKQGDSDPFNKLTGTTGIVGAVDTAFVLDKNDHRVEGPTISIQMAKAEGWYDKNGSKWKTMPDVMLLQKPL